MLKKPIDCRGLSRNPRQFLGGKKNAENRMVISISPKTVEDCRCVENVD